LTEDPEFVGNGGGLLGAVFGLVSGWFSPQELSSETVLARRALGVFKASRNIERVGRTYVLNIGYSSLSPAHAAGIANAIADAYVTDQLEAKYTATKRAGSWLQDRIKELRMQAALADKAVLDYKEKNNIVDIGAESATGGNGGRLLGEQALVQLNTELGAARNATAEAKAKLDRIQVVMKQDVPDAGVTDSLRNEVITRLRNSYLDLSQREAIWSVRYGADHLATINLRVQMNEIRRSIADELGRIAESYKSDYEIAKGRQASLEQSFVKQISDSQGINRDRLGLRDLESSAHVYHTIYDNFLQHYMEAIQQESFPITEARVISSAAPPTVKSSPRTPIVFSIAAILGLIVSVAAAGLREAMDRVFRTTKHVEENLGTNCLAVLPLLKNVVATKTIAIPKGRVPKEPVLSQRKILFDQQKFMRHVVDEPLSSFAEAFRSVKVAVDISGTIKENKVIGVTSTVPQEGKSTVSCNFAELVAHAGKRVILVDADLRNPTLTRNLAGDAKTGLLEILSGKSELRQAVYVDDLTGLTFLPVVIESRLAHSSEIVASDAFRRLIDNLRQSYDYVIVDLPPMAPVVDVRATLNIIDSYLFVIEWGKTRISTAQHQLASAPEIFDRLLGVVLNKANMGVLDRYQYYYNYSKKYYHQYGYTS
jgi:succinoglycan biosynthesis transport protein ExoP